MYAGARFCPLVMVTEKLVQKLRSKSRYPVDGQLVHDVQFTVYIDHVTSRMTSSNSTPML